MVGTATVFAAVFASANKALEGPTFLSLVALGVVGALLIVEGAHRDGRIRVVLLAAGVCVITFASGIAVIRAAQGRHRLASAPLRIAIASIEPALTSLAFPVDIGLPGDGIGWSQLRHSGGVDVYSSQLRVTLANRSRSPLTITDVHLELIASSAPPRGAYFYTFTQGDENLEPFVAELSSTKPGAVSKLYRIEQGGPWSGEGTPKASFFDRHFISLAPGEIYEAKLSVTTQIPRLLEYRLTVAGSTAAGEFLVHERHVLRLSGLVDLNSAAYGARYVEGYLAYMHNLANMTTARVCADIPVRRWFAEPRTGLAGSCGDLVAALR